MSIKEKQVGARGMASDERGVAASLLSLLLVLRNCLGPSMCGYLPSRERESMQSARERKRWKGKGFQ